MVPLLVRAACTPAHPNRAAKYASALRSRVPMVVATGPAGCGKTMHACEYAIEALRDGEIERVVMTRPIVPVDGEQLGFLPGDLDGKLRPWMMPIWDQLYARHSPREVDAFVRDDRLVMEPLGMMRGRTFDHTLVIGDEMQNATVNQMRMLLTRIGTNSRVVITGDETQRDLEEGSCGLTDLIRRLDTRAMDRATDRATDRGDEDTSLGVRVHFEESDVRRSAFVEEVIRLYAPPS